MVDNVSITAGSGTVVATDDVGGVQYQRVKLDGGGDGLTLPLIASTTSPSADAAGLLTREVGQDVWSAGFSATQATLDGNFVELRIGTGIGRSQASSNLILTSGTTANAEFLARSTTSFTGAMLMRFRHTLSQRIANNSFVAMLADRIGEGLTYTNTATTLTVTLTAHGFDATTIGQSICVGGINATSGTAVPGRYAIASITDANTIVFTVASWATGGGTLNLFGRSYARTIFTSTIATQALFDVGNKGWSDVQFTATTNTTLSPGHLLQVHLDGRNAYQSDATVGSTSVPNVTTRTSRVEFVPDDTTPLYFYIWLYNGTTNPATTTTWTIGQCSVESYANLPVYIAGQRLQGTAAAAPVQVVGTPGVSLQASVNLSNDVGIQYRATSTGGATIKHIVSLATTNATVVKAGAGRLLGWNLVNTTAAFKFVKIHNVAVTPTPGAAVAQTIGLPPNGVENFVLEGGIGYATGIGYTITGASPDADTTAVAAGDVIGDLFYQ